MDAKTIGWGKTVFSTNSAEKLDSHMQKYEAEFLPHTTLKIDQDRNVRAQTVKRLEGNRANDL